MLRYDCTKEAPLRSNLLHAVIVFTSLLACCGKAGQVAESVVRVADGKVVLSAGEWRAMPNEADYAQNFEAVTNTSPRRYQIITFFLNPMTEDRRSGQKISTTEYFEAFLTNPDEITVLLTKDHGNYWLLSREMFTGVVISGVNTSRVGSFSGPEVERVAEALRNQIDSTRYLIGQRLLAR